MTRSMPLAVLRPTAAWRFWMRCWSGPQSRPLCRAIGSPPCASRRITSAPRARWWIACSRVTPGNEHRGGAALAPKGEPRPAAKARKALQGGPKRRFPSLRSGVSGMPRKSRICLLILDVAGISPRISHGNMAVKAVRWHSGPQGSLFAHTFPEEPTGELQWRYLNFPCASCLKLAFISVTSLTAGIRRWPNTFSAFATTSTSSISRRPCRSCIARCRP